MSAREVSRLSKKLGGDGSIAIFYQDHRNVWQAVTPVKAPRKKDRFATATRETPDAALRALHDRVRELDTDPTT